MIYILIVQESDGVWQAVRQTYADTERTSAYEAANGRLRSLQRLYGSAHVQMIPHRLEALDLARGTISAAEGLALNRDYEDGRRAYREIQPIRAVTAADLFRGEDDEEPKP